MVRGYDNTPVYVQCLLDIQMREGNGTLIRDWAKPEHPVTLHGTPTWAQLGNGLNYLDFDSTNPDWLDSPQAGTADLDFTTESFSLALWVDIDSLAAARALIIRGLLDTDGYEIYVETDGSIVFRTNQAAANQITTSAAGDIVINNWYQVILTRSGTDALIYLNGIDVTDTAGSHTDPLTSARELHIGILDDETNSPFEGQMWRPRMWGRQLSAVEAVQLFNYERDWLGV